MKFPVKKEVDVTMVKVVVAVRYDEEDIPNDFPLRNHNVWSATIDIHTGQIQHWPKGNSGNIYMKVCDQGSYFLLDNEGDIVAKIEENYVPNGLIPGEYGDYIDLKINEDGVITNWKKNPSLEAFMEIEEY